MQSLKHIIGYSLPFWLIFLFFGWYSYWDLALRSLIKATGLVGILLFALTFIIGPINKFIPQLNGWKMFRKYWGICATIIIFAHLILAFVDVYKLSLARMFSTNFSGTYANYRFGFWFGFMAFCYFAFMVAISNRASMAKLGKAWKVFQSFGYVAFTAALVHFILLETDPKLGFIIRKPLGRWVFAIAIAAFVLRIFVWIWDEFTKKDLVDVDQKNSEVAPDPDH